VDGVAVNQPGGLFDFGTALPLELERVEVVRGATSSLYGSDALAGAIQIVTRRAGIGEAPGLRAEADAGSFGWKRGELGPRAAPPPSTGASACCARHRQRGPQQRLRRDRAAFSAARPSATPRS